MHSEFAFPKHNGALCVPMCSSTEEMTWSCKASSRGTQGLGLNGVPPASGAALREHHILGDLKQQERVLSSRGQKFKIKAVAGPRAPEASRRRSFPTPSSFWWLPASLGLGQHHCCPSLGVSWPPPPCVYLSFMWLDMHN